MTRLAWIVLALTFGCVDTPPTTHGDTSILQLPEHVPSPRLPAGNPLTVEAIELGRHLFYDARLSVNETISCSSCHQQQYAFADNRPVSVGATGQVGVLNAPSLTNVVYANPLTWSHAQIVTIEDQLTGPMFGEAPLEMGMAGSEQAIIARLYAEPRYAELFSTVYTDGAIDLDRVRFALASFVRSLVSFQSPFDAFLLGDATAISASARRGSELFYSARLQCGSCHAGFAFTSAVRSTVSSGQQLSPFHNVGLYNVDGQGGYPESALGLIATTGVARDMGRFRVPTLRNVALSAPYMHDGSVATLADVLAIYEAGGRHVQAGQHAGDGRLNPFRSRDLPTFQLTATEREDVLAFLRSLSDINFANDARHASPW